MGEDCEHGTAVGKRSVFRELRVVHNVNDVGAPVDNPVGEPADFFSGEKDAYSDTELGGKRPGGADELEGDTLEITLYLLRYDDDVIVRH
jgi:hypothetical protein